MTSVLYFVQHTIKAALLNRKTGLKGLLILQTAVHHLHTHYIFSVKVRVTTSRCCSGVSELKRTA